MIWTEQAIINRLQTKHPDGVMLYYADLKLDDIVDLIVDNTFTSDEQDDLDADTWDRRTIAEDWIYDNENEEIKEEIASRKAEEINSLTREYFETHLVTCWRCWGILNQLDNQETSKTIECDDWDSRVISYDEVAITDWDITCPYCKFVSEPCDFPDLFY